MNTRRPERVFIGSAVLAFAASTAVTIAWCSSMSAMPGMEMPGGWTMSMAWMRMPGQSWLGAAATFMAMWAVMMVAMMLPVLVPMLARYRASRLGDTRLNRQTAFVAAGYFAVWTLFGAIAYPLGAMLAEATMRSPGVSRVIPLASGVVLAIAGASQFTSWKARQLACCLESPACCARPRDRGNAWQHGLRLGVQCVSCCLGPTAALLVIGIMDLRAMAVVALAICAERLAPAGERAARVIGAALIVAAPFFIRPS
jgi:predicted metal-binding membrane protein